MVCGCNYKESAHHDVALMLLLMFSHFYLHVYYLYKANGT